MPKPFDATLKHLIEHFPLDWLRLLHVEPAGPVMVVDSDLSTLTAAADKVIRVDEAEPWLLQIEVQSSYDPSLPERMHYYSTLLSRRHRAPVRSVAVLLRPEADGRTMTGIWSRSHPRTGRYLEFWYDVLRVWELPAAVFRQGGVGVLPLSVVTEDAGADLPGLVEFSRQEATELGGTEFAKEVLAAEYILLGLRYPREFVKTLFREIHEMRESTTYQAILEEGLEQGLEEGREAGLREAILSLGELSLGPADASVRQSLDEIHDPEQLKALLRRASSVSHWRELLNDPAASPRKRCSGKDGAEQN